MPNNMGILSLMNINLISMKKIMAGKKVFEKQDRLI
jgi:hypothetical protein